jgi:hypothetical protein
MRTRNRDLEPVEHQLVLPAKAYDEIVQLQREYGNQAVTNWIAKRAQFRRLTPAEQREQTENRAEEITKVLSTTWSSEAEVATQLARIFGLCDLEPIARKYGELVSQLGLAETLERLDCTPDLDDRTRTAIQLVLLTLKRQV